MWGIEAQYEDAFGTQRRTPAKTERAVLEAMGVDPNAPHRPADETADVLIATAGEVTPVSRPGELQLEDGTTLSISASLPPDLPLGYHRLRADHEDILVIVSPGRCVLPRRPTWGWAVQLYSVRSQASWGIGDLADLKALAQWSAQLGAGMVMLNPLHAPAPVLPQEASPYYPSSRRFRNPLYLRIEDVPGSSSAGEQVASLASQARELNRSRRIDRDRVFRLKQEALSKIWQHAPRDAAFDSYCAEQGRALGDFATYCVLAETFGKSWRNWDASFQHPTNPAVLRFADEHAERVKYHKWLQWLLDEQLRAAAAELPVMQDLAIGVDADGADAWTWQDVFAHGISIGAPPDVFNTQGQNWGLPPFIPHMLREANYEPFIQTIRATLRHAGGLRIDHAMGLFRLYWIPHGMEANEGAYVRYPADELLAILAVESARSGAFVVGEDLGTVELEARKQLADHQILSYRLVWFEAEHPRNFPRLALAAVTTHDLPTIAGLWTGRDLDEQRKLGLQPDEEYLGRLRAHLGEVAGNEHGGSAHDVIERSYAALAEAPSLLLTAMLEDVLEVSERPNMPSTTTERPNWSLALPRSLEELKDVPLVRAVATSLTRHGAAADASGENELACRAR